VRKAWRGGAASCGRSAPKPPDPAPRLAAAPELVNTRPGFLAPVNPRRATMGKINQSTAISNAEKAASSWYKSNKEKVDAKTYTGVFNTGDDDDWVSSDLQETIRKAWIAKGEWNGLERRASFSSGENKFDLKFAIEGKSNACFNYHVPFKKDDSAEKARLEQSAKDKEIAEAFKKEQAKKEAEAEKLKKAQDDAAKLEKARMVKVDLAANKAWNVHKTTKAYKKTDNEANWKKAWIKDNGAKIK
jgi:hypothetical protein